jgi:hypothetical protein
MNPPSLLVIEDDALIGGLLAEMLVSLGRDTVGIQMTQDEASLMPGIPGASESTPAENPLRYPCDRLCAIASSRSSNACDRTVHRQSRSRRAPAY